MRITFPAVAAPAVAALVLTGCGMGAPYPEFGEAAYRLEGLSANPNGGPATRTVIYRDGRKMRVETVLPEHGEATIVFDEATGSAYVLDPIAPLPGADLAALNAEGAPGLAVRLENALAPQPMEMAWEALGPARTRAVGGCRVAGVQGAEWTPKEEPAPGVRRSACITRDGIVLSVHENERVLWQAQRLERGPQSAALFGVPVGYRLFDPANAPPVTDPDVALDAAADDAAQARGAG